MLAFSIIWFVGIIGVVLYFSLYKKTPYYNETGAVSLPYLLAVPAVVIGAVTLSIGLTKPGPIPAGYRFRDHTSGFPQRMNTAGVFGR